MRKGAAALDGSGFEGEDAEVGAGFFVFEVGGEFAGVAEAKEESDGAVVVADGVFHFHESPLTCSVGL